MSFSPKTGLRDLLRRAQGGSLDRGAADNLIQAPHIKRRLQRGLNLKEMAPVPSLSSEVISVVVVDDLTKEKSDQAREWLCSAELTSSVGNASGLEFGVNASDTRYVHVEGVWLKLPSAQTVRWKKKNTFAGTAIVNAAQTPRGKGVTLSGVNALVPFEIRKDDTNLFLSFGDSHALNYNTTFPFYPFDVDIYPGEIFYIQSSGLAISMECALQVTTVDNPA